MVSEISRREKSKLSPSRLCRECSSGIQGISIWIICSSQRCGTTAPTYSMCLTISHASGPNTCGNVCQKYHHRYSSSLTRNKSLFLFPNFTYLHTCENAKQRSHLISNLELVEQMERRPREGGPISIRSPQAPKKWVQD